MTLTKNDGERDFFAGYTPKGFQQITDLSSVVALTVPNEAHFALLQCETQAVRWRDDGTNPSATVGMKLPVEVYFFYSGNLDTVRFIAAASGAVLNITYY